MNQHDDIDRNFHHNLTAVAAGAGVPPGPSAEVLSNCRNQLSRSGGRTFGFLRRPAFISSVSIAACFALFFGLLYQPGGEQQVNAAVILAKLNDQIAEAPLMNIKIESLKIDDVEVEGHLQISPEGVAGDLRVKTGVREEAGRHGPVNLDVALGISQAESWVLIRKLEVPDPQAMAMLRMFCPPGTETLIKMPADEMDFGTDLQEGIEELKGESVTAVIRELIASADELGATVEDQPDGTVLLSLKIDDADTLESLHKLKSISGEGGPVFGGEFNFHFDGHEPAHETLREHVAADKTEEEIRTQHNDMIFGMTIHVTYDPVLEEVNSIVLDGIGEADDGRIALTIEQGEPDQDLFDSSRVTDENTRVFDLEALTKMMESLEAHHQGGDE